MQMWYNTIQIWQNAKATKGNKKSYAEYRNLQTRCVVTWWHFVNVMLPACCLTLMCCCMVAWSMETTHPVTLSLGGIIKGMPPPCRHLLGVEWSKGCHKIVFLWPCHKVTEWWDSLLLRTPKNANQVWKILYLFLRKNTFENSESCNR